MDFRITVSSVQGFRNMAQSTLIEVENRKVSLEYVFRCECKWECIT